VLSLHARPQLTLRSWATGERVGLLERLLRPGWLGVPEKSASLGTTERVPSSDLTLMLPPPPGGPKGVS
jgi:hypothetical protein